MQKIKCRTAYTARDEEHTGVIFPSDSLVQRHFQPECDVNLIVERYVRTGEMEHLNDAPAAYGDVSEIPTDLIAAYDAVNRAEVAFMDLPSGLRKALDNDPARLSDWLRDENNRADAVKYGLLTPSADVQSDSTVVEPKKGSESAANTSEPQ